MTISRASFSASARLASSGNENAADENANINPKILFFIFVSFTLN
jgi:hypothetical protein